MKVPSLPRVISLPLVKILPEVGKAQTPMVKVYARSIDGLFRLVAGVK